MVIDHGTSIAEGTADQLKAAVGGERLELVACDESQVEKILIAIEGIATERAYVNGPNLCVPIATGPKALTEAVRRLDEMQIEVRDIGLRRPTLDDVFLSLTGHAAEENANEMEMSK
jgi:ABC-2 type transport system ATP-binding protein